MFTLVLADLSEVTLADSTGASTSRSLTPVDHPKGGLVAHGRGSAVPDDYEIAVDFMDLTNDRHLWARAVDARSDVELSIGLHVVVGDEDADSKVARIVAFDADGNVELEVLPGSVESHSDLLAPA